MKLTDVQKRRIINYFAPIWLGGFKASFKRLWRGGWPAEVLFVLVMVMSFTAPIPDLNSEEMPILGLMLLFPLMLLWVFVAVCLIRSADKAKNKLWRTVFKLYGITMMLIAGLMGLAVAMAIITYLF